MSTSSDLGADSNAVQRGRARQYAICTYALDYGRVADGAEGIFDQALTNGLAAIVAHTWPGAEMSSKGRALSAAGLLDVIEERGQAVDGGIVRVPHEVGGPEYTDLPFDEGPMPNFTSVEIEPLRDAIRTTQAIRHARDLDNAAATVLTDAHMGALRELDYHPALFSLSSEAIDRLEEVTWSADATERARAERYLEALGDTERRRREQIDYAELYGFETTEDRVEVEECPVCLQTALVAATRDPLLDEIGVGHCVVCGYERTAGVAGDMALGVQIERATGRDD